MSSKWLAAVGIIPVLFGSWMVAYEVVSKFRGISHTVSVGWGGAGSANKSGAFLKWEARRNCAMWAGLAFITVGSMFQFFALIIA